MDHKINLLNPKFGQPNISGLAPLGKGGRPKNKPSKSVAFILIFIIIILAVSSMNTSPEEESTTWFGRLPIIKQIRHLVKSADTKLKGEDRDRINILILVCELLN